MGPAGGMAMRGAALMAGAVPAPAATAGDVLPYAEEVREIDEIRNGLATIAIGDKIRESCPAAAANWLRVWSFGRRLQSLARRAGYSDAQIERYVENDAEKAYYAALARRWLAERGVSGDDDADGHCRIAREEIARGSRLGVLLWSQGS